MGIFDFFRKKQVLEKEKIKLDNIDKYINNKKKENETKEKQFFESIKNSLDDLINLLAEKNNVLKKINLDEKKADPRAIFIIRENLAHYIELLDRLIEELKQLESENLSELITDIDSLFIDFEQRSRLNFEKATFLIGKELGEVKDAINNFIRNLKKELDENKSILENSKILSQIEARLGELDENVKIINEINNNIKDNNLKIKSIEGNISSSEVEIVKLRSSESYKKETSLEAEINVKNEELEKEAYKLKDMIDFKKLANLFHYDSKKMTTINEYKLNFINTFNKDKLLSLVPLLDEANMADSFISQKANEIMHKEKEIGKIKSEFNKKESESIVDLNKKLTSLRSDLEYTLRENQKEEKRKEKTEKTRKDVLELLNQEFTKINVDLDIE